jgi:hypothetical protein
MSRGSARALRLLAAEPLPAVPDAGMLLGSAVRRPGELHEPLPLSPAAAEDLARAARACGTDCDVLGSVLLEAALAVEDLGERRFTALDPLASVPPGLALSAAEAGYLRALGVGRRPRIVHARPRPAIPVPVRLTARLAQLDVERELARVPPALALRWERAAVARGRTLSEWALLRAALSSL